jgi:hypothetical protein
MKTKGISPKSRNCFYALSFIMTIGILLITNSCNDELKNPTDQENTLKAATFVQSGIAVNLIEPIRFVREIGKPLTELKSIPGFNPDIFESSFQLKIKNGSKPKLSVNSAVIKIDGKIVVSSRDFSPNVELITKEVLLKPEGSLLEVQLAGSPGSFIDLWIEGIKKEVGLVAYYPFNGNANDESGNNNHGSLNGPLLCPDRFGNANSAYLFDGINDFIRIEESPSLQVSTGLSVCAWVKCLHISDHGRIVSKWGGGSEYFCSYDISFLASSDVLFEVLDLPGNSPTGIGYGPVTTNEWYFLVGTFDGENIYLYINGELKGTASFPKVLYQGLPVFIGCENGTWLFFNGIIDDVRIYNRALSETEILALYN